MARVSALLRHPRLGSIKRRSAMQIKKHDRSHMVELRDGSAWRIWPGDIPKTLQWLADDGDRRRGHRRRNLFARADQSLERVTGASDKCQHVLACGRRPALPARGLSGRPGECRRERTYCTSLRLTRQQARRDLPEEEIMPHTRYIVVQHKDEWLIKFGDEEYGPYHSRAEAMLFAIDAAQKLGEQGENTQVGLMGEHGRFRAEWSYGKDPYPPQGL